MGTLWASLAAGRARGSIHINPSTQRNCRSEKEKGGELVVARICVGGRWKYKKLEIVALLFKMRLLLWCYLRFRPSALRFNLGLPTA